jgi:hypothetical protein
MDNSGQDGGRGKLIDLAERVALGWRDRLGVEGDAGEWVGVKGGGRTPISAGAAAAVHWLEKGAGVAFVLGGPNVVDLLFVVRSTDAAYSVNISNHAKPLDRGERHLLRADFKDLNRLMMAAARYARKCAA